MSDTPGIRPEHDGHVARLTIHNPARRNAMCHTMWHELGDSLTAIEENPAVLCHRTFWSFLFEDPTDLVSANWQRAGAASPPGLLAGRESCLGWEPSVTLRSWTLLPLDLTSRISVSPVVIRNLAIRLRISQHFPCRT